MGDYEKHIRKCVTHFAFGIDSLSLNGSIMSLYSSLACAFTAYETMDVNGNKAFGLGVFMPNDGAFIAGTTSSWLFDQLTIGHAKSATSHKYKIWP